MSIWNKVLIGFIFVATLAFFLFAARTLKTHAAWRKSIADHEKAIEAMQEKNQELAHGKQGIRELKLQLEQLTNNRPRIWSGCTPRNVNAQTGAVAVAVESPTPHQIKMKSVLYVFDENDVAQGGRYLGKFTVVQVDDKQVGLQPAYTVTPAEVTRMQQARGPWSLYENLPVDEHKLFAGMDEAAKKAMFPPTTVEEYLTDGQDEQGEWKRKLRDYKVLFDLYYRQRADRVKQIEAATRDLQYLTTAVAGQEEQKKFFEGLLATLKDELKAAQAELTAVTAHQKAVDERLTAMKAAIEQLTQQNQAAVAQLARAQWDATQRIEERAKRMAQARSTD